MVALPYPIYAGAIARTIAVKRVVINSSHPADAEHGANEPEAIDPDDPDDAWVTPEDYNTAYDWSALRFAALAAELDFTVCGRSLSSILKLQLQEELEVGRQALAYRALSQSLSAIEPGTLRMLAQLKKPPPLLKGVLTCVLILLNRAPHASATGTSVEWESIQGMLKDSAAMKGEMAALNLDDVTAQQVAALEPFLQTTELSQVISSVKFVAPVWLWVTAVAVICGALHAVLPNEVREAVVRRRRFSLSRSDHPLTSRPRTNNGAPITASPVFDRSSSAAPISARRLPNRKARARGSSIQRWLPLVKSHAATMDELAPIKLLGAGGFANVFLVRNQRTGEILALKALIKSLLLKKKKLKQVGMAISRRSHGNG